MTTTDDDTTNEHDDLTGAERAAALAASQVVEQPTFSAEDAAEWATDDEIAAGLLEFGLVDPNTTRYKAAAQYIRTGRLDCEMDAFAVQNIFGLDGLPPYADNEPTPEQLALVESTFGEGRSPFDDDDPADLT